MVGTVSDGIETGRRARLQAELGRGGPVKRCRGFPTVIYIGIKGVMFLKYFLLDAWEIIHPLPKWKV